jgi:hypothetical protein
MSLALALSFAALILTGGKAMAIEEPRYEVLASTDDYEVRRYEARRVTKPSESWPAIFSATTRHQKKWR